jgi:hypothetical protein
MSRAAFLVPKGPIIFPIVFVFWQRSGTTAAFRRLRPKGKKTARSKINIKTHLLWQKNCSLGFTSRGRGLISSMFYKQLLRSQIQHAQKRQSCHHCLFAPLGSAKAKAARRTLMKLTPRDNAAKRGRHTSLQHKLDWFPHFAANSSIFHFIKKVYL